MSVHFDAADFTPDQLRGIVEYLSNHLEQHHPQDFSTQVQKVRDERVKGRIQELQVTVSLYETVNAAFEVVLTEVLGDPTESRWIVSQLDKCRRENDFRKMNSVYFKYSRKDLKVEEMLKTLAAVYRLKVKKYNSPDQKSKDRSIVRHEIRCPHCGELALKLVKFLEVKGIKWADV
jgi:hypothetical protein